MEQELKVHDSKKGMHYSKLGKATFVGKTPLQTGIRRQSSMNNITSSKDDTLLKRQSSLNNILNNNKYDEISSKMLQSERN